MRAKIFSVLLVIFLGTYSVNGQVPIFENNEETARRLDALEGRDTPERRETPDPNRNNNDSGNNNSLFEAWEEIVGPLLSDIKEVGDKFDTPATRCIYMIVVYLDAYMDIVERTDGEQDSRTKCDGYALQLTAIAASASMIYCPESLANKTAEEKNRIWNDDLMPILANEDNNNLITIWKQKLERVTHLNFSLNESMNFRGPEHINDMVHFFHPNYIITQLLDIQQDMEILNCSE